jgi:predicted membrane-bound spermidine synthase
MADTAASLPSQQESASNSSPRIAHEPGGRSVRAASVYLIFFFSGLASLICEVVWFKQLQLVLGSSTFAVSIVVACFFGGLACGSWLGGRFADRLARVLRAYALLELVLGLVSAGVSLLLSQWMVWSEWFAPWLAPGSSLALPLMMLLSLVILLPPTALMGATLPVLARYLVRQPSHLARRIGFLYGLNTLGAAVGCGLVGFVLIGLYGVLESALTASCIYLVIAGLALLLSRREPPRTGPAPVPPAQPDVKLLQPPVAPASTRVLMMVFGLSGFTSIAYEVLWFRLLRGFSIPTVYAFSGMLCVYLLGLVLGALICARFLAPHKERLLTYFAVTQLLTALAAFLSLALLGRGRNILTWLSSFEPRLGSEAVMAGTFAGVVPFVGLSLLVLLLPTLVLGIGFPLAAELTVERLSQVGTRLGSLYSLNTLGGVLGSLSTGFLLLPLLGSFFTFVLVVALNMLLFVLLLATQPGLRTSGPLWRAAVLGSAFLLLMFAFLGKDYLKEGQAHFVNAQVLDFREGRDATFAVLEYDFLYTGKYQQLVANGTSYANNFPPGRRYMSMLGHLPALLHPDPKRVTVIAIGTGTTVGSLSLHSRIDKLWAVDIAKDVFDFEKYFRPLNNNFLQSPKVHPVVADGRHFLLTTDQQFDVMTFEPPPPQEAGVVNLYSREFYQLAKRRLAPGGILCQWMPLDLSHEVLSRMMLKTLQAEFDHVSLWIPCRYEGVAIASMEPLHVDPEALRSRMAEPAVQRDLASCGLGTVEQVLATFVTADTGLSDYVRNVPLVTDNYPRTEYFNFYPLGQVRFKELLSHEQPIAKYLTRPTSKPDDLERERKVQRALWYSYELERDKRYNDARALIEQALQLGRHNPYLRYRLAVLTERTKKP